MVYYLHMKTSILRYNVIIRKEARDYIAYVPSLGISDFGKTIEEAKRHVRDAIACHVEGLIKTNTEVPIADEEDYYISHAEIPVPATIKFAF